MHRKQSHRPPTHVLVGVIAAGILAATVACDVGQTDPPGPEYLGMCVNQLGYRVPDDECGVNQYGAAVAAAFAWDYIDTYRYPNYVMAGYGSRVNVTNITVVHTTPSGASVSRSVPRAGGSATTVRSRLASTSGTGGKSSIQRGGFGVSGRGASSDSAVSRSAGS